MQQNYEEIFMYNSTKMNTFRNKLLTWKYMIYNYMTSVTYAL